MNMRRYIDLLNYHTKLYNEGHPEISDELWDKMYYELQAMEAKSGIYYPDSPTQTIKYEIVSELKKIEHNHPMLSLDKSKDPEVIKKFLGNQEYVGMFKLDGLTLSLTYQDGELVGAETRGDGRIGEDVLHNARVIKSIPKHIPQTSGRVVVDGEVICLKEDFEPFSAEYKNPRNFAAGSIRLLSATECEKRNLTFVAWDLIECPNMEDFLPEEENLKIHFSDKLYILDIFGFKVTPYFCSTIDNFVNAINILATFQKQQERLKETYPIDGYVFKFNDIEYGENLGRTDHHFKNAIALKFHDEGYSTRLKYIEWGMGRSGVLTPIAVFQPIDIEGTTIERASLHNYSVMQETLGEYAYIGESLKVIKSNMIIPQIIDAGPKLDYTEIISHGGATAGDQIEKCPYCGEAVEFKDNNGVVTVWCANDNCEGRFINRLEHFAGKKGLDIKGLSKATFDKLIDWGWITEIKDIYNLHVHREDWIKKTGFGVASVDKILNSIEEHRNTTLDAFISAIGIPLIGRTAAKKLCEYFYTYEDFRDAVMDDTYNFFTIDSFGMEMNDSLKNFDYSEADELFKFLNINVPVVSSKQINNTLDGKVIVITGKLTTFKNRNELKEVIIQHGGKVSDSISGKTNILINNDVNSESAKNKAAKARNIPIISEADFVKLYIENS